MGTSITTIRRIAQSIGLASLACLAACATPTPTGSLASLNADWFYPPGPTTRLQETDKGERTTRVSPEIGNAWTVTIGDPPTTIAVQRLPDGRPATTLIADPQRNETAVFDPPLPLLPKPGLAPPATETASLTLYKGLHPTGIPPGTRPTRTGTAERRFLAAQPATWADAGTPRPAQRLVHELILSLGPLQIRQSYETLATRELGVVDETMTRRITFLGVRVQSETETARTIEPR
jgi:hypothetical protein